MWRSLSFQLLPGTFCSGVVTPNISGLNKINMCENKGRILNHDCYIAILEIIKLCTFIRMLSTKCAYKIYIYLM